ncbi:hypothetical protein BTHI11S_00309 [Bosea thiooxidans]
MTMKSAKMKLEIHHALGGDDRSAEADATADELADHRAHKR